ncbi:MAG: molybdopterin-dependent oxidoreductase [Thermodesulfobacteriota bacterium]
MPKLNRRKFLKLGVSGAAAVALGPGVIKAMELTLAGESYDYMVLTEREAIPYIVNDTAIKNAAIAFVEKETGKLVQVGGDPHHPGTRGKLSPEENAVNIGIYDQDRILYPLKRSGPRGEGNWEKISWDDALDEVAGKIGETLENGQPDEICLYSGERAPEVAWQRFMHGLGSSSILRESTMGSGSKKTAMRHTWGAEMETPDFANSQYILDFGSNLFETLHPYAQRVTEAMVDNKAKFVTFDVRITNTSGRSDEWVPIFPGTDGLVALAMANVIMSEGLADTKFIDMWTNYTAKKLAAHLKAFTPELAEKASGVPAHTIKRIAAEFATTKPATVFTHNSISSHLYGAYQERACMLLPIITGNVEVRGGYCLPRVVTIPDMDPTPKAPKGADTTSPVESPDYLLPFRLKDGSRKVSVLLNHGANPAYSSPAASVWRETLKDHGLVPFIVEFGSSMTETAELADIIFPDAHYLESNDLISSPSSLWPWVGLNRPVIKPRGESRDVRMVLRELARRADSDDKYGLAKYFDFKTSEDWIKGQIEKIPALVEAGGYDNLMKNGVWPRYGKLDPNSKRLMTDDKRHLKAEYGLHEKPLSSGELSGARTNPKTGVITKNGKAIGIKVGGRRVRGFDTPSRKLQIYVEAFKKHGLDPLPTWKESPLHQGLKKGEMVLTTYKAVGHTTAAAANNKYLAEFMHSNHALINKQTAAGLGIHDMDMIRVTSAAGYMVTRARATQGIHPGVVAISTSFGHHGGGRVATAHRHGHAPMWSGKFEDHDIEHNLWWEDNGVHPNDIIPPAPDPTGGSQGWGDTTVTVTPAEPGDRYGDIEVDNAKHFALYKESLKRS